LTFLSSFFLKNLPILISFNKFDRINVQSQLPAVLAARREKTAYAQRRSGIRRLQPPGRFADTDRLDFAIDAPRFSGLDLLRLVPDHAFHHRHAGRSETQRLALDQGSREFDAVQRSLVS
jgi:hypothetical protein